MKKKSFTFLLQIRKEAMKVRGAICLTVNIICLCSHFLSAQQNPQTNLMINPYDLSSVPYNSSGEFFYNDNSGLTTSGLDGEYLFKVPLEWKEASNQNMTLYYRIENLSFPFVPQCYNNCVGTTNRNMTIGGVLQAYSSPYAEFGSSGLAWDGEFAQKTPFFSFPSSGISLPTQLNSYAFLENGFFSAPQRLINRNPLPHSILKHTVYLYCNQSEMFVDSLSWIYDNTRGPMKKYPFGGNTENCGGAIGCYDVIFLPQFMHHGVNGYYTHSEYTHSNNDSWYCFDSNPANCSGTIDYFPIDESYQYENTSFLCGSGCEPLFVPFNFDGYFPPTSLCEYFHPAPYTLLWGHLLNFEMNSLPGHEDGKPMNAGIEHEYEAGGFDISLINPAEKEFYNPSEVTITAPLTFPCGYTFRTVYGRYPERSDVEQYQADHWNLYPDIRKMPAPIRADEAPSVYHVNSTLTIEPCVKIMDADFYVNPGGAFIFDPSKTFGNYNIIPNGGSVVHQPMPDCNCKIKCFEPGFYLAKDIDISSDVIWEPYNYTINGVHYNYLETIQIAGIVSIKKGCTLTIKNNARIEFGHYGGIIVEPGGHLIVENSTLTSACEMLWKGVTLQKLMLLGIGIPHHEVMATATVAGSVIENAYIGINSSTRFARTPYPAGRIVATNTSFRNNYISILLEGEKINAPITVQRLKAHNCVFETTDLLYENIYLWKEKDNRCANAHIKAENSNRIQLRNNHFSCNTAVFKPHERPTGIFSYNSSFVTYQAYPNTFDGLREGIWAAHTGTPDYIRIDGMTFDNCIHSVVLEGTNYSLVQRSVFNIPQSPDLDEYQVVGLLKGYNKPVGVYLRECDNFVVQGNVFNATNASDDEYEENLSYGIVANSIGSNAGLDDYTSNPPILDEFEYRRGLVFHNEFYNNSVSVQSELNNYGYSGGWLSSIEDPALQYNAGLTISCNVFEFSKVNSIYIIGDGNMSQFQQYIEIFYGILRNQFSWAMPANNRFKGSSYDFAFNEETSEHFSNYPPLRYYYPLPTFETFGYRLNPTSNDFSKIETVDTSPYAEYGCILKIKDPVLAEIIQEIEQVSTFINQRSNEYNELIDGGNTQNLLSFIHSPGATGIKRQVLLQFSPYLSDTSLIAAVNPNTSLPSGHIKQIVNANSPVSFRVLKYIENRQPALPQGTLNSIMSVQTGVSEREKLEAEISALLFQLDVLYAELFRAGIETGDFADVIDVIREKDTLSSVRRFERMFDAYFENQEFEKADSMLNDLVLANNIQYSDYEIFIRQLNVNMQLDTVSASELDAVSVGILENQISLAPETAFKSKSILKASKNAKFKRDPIANQFSNKNMVNDNTPEDIVDNEANVADVTIIPNPARDKIQINCLTLEEHYVAIFNSTGSVVYENKHFCGEHINIENLPTGYYLVKITTQDGGYFTSKIVKL